LTNYIAGDVFTPSQIYDLSDLVQGGYSGDANTPLKALADQSNYLRNRLRRWEGIKTITDNYTVDAVADLGYLLFVQINANKTLTLPNAGNFLVGTRIKILTAITGIKALTVQSQASQAIVDGSITWTKWDTGAPGIYMHDSEKLVLVAAGDHWLVEDAVGNFYTYGDTFGARIQRGNTVICNGTTYNRADMPRIALIVSGGGSSVKTEFSWIAGGDLYKGCFSNGDGTSTMRVPDERAMFDRYLDLGRGIDLYRISSVPGAFEDEQVGKHTHPIVTPPEATSQGQNGTGYFTGGGEAHEPFGMVSFDSKQNAGSQQIVKNIGKIPLIKY